MPRPRSNRMQPKPVVSALCIAAFLMTVPGFAQTQTARITPKPAVPAKPSDPFLNGPPLKFEQAVQLLRQSAIPLNRRKEAIQRRGLDFVVSSEAVAKLKAAGASEDMLKLMKGKGKVTTATLVPPPAPPVQPAPPKRPPAGRLAISCEPAECEVSVNGTPRGSTTGGKLEIAEVPVGTWAIEFKKDGYVGHPVTVAVEQDKAASVAAVLDPNLATQEAFGTELFRKVIEALGGADGVKELASVQATGSTTVWTCDNKSSRWTLFMRNRPDRALFQATASGSTLHEVLFIGAEFKTGKKKDPDALDLATDFGVIRDSQLSGLLAKLADPRFKMRAKHATPVAGEEFNLFADGGTEAISIGLDKDLLPQRVRIVTATGVGSASVNYSDYVKAGKTFYPRSLQIKPEGWQHGVDARFDSVQLNPKLDEKDYKLRGKRLVSLRN
jgi:PEGA domain